MNGMPEPMISSAHRFWASLVLISAKADSRPSEPNRFAVQCHKSSISSQELCLPVNISTSPCAYVLIGVGTAKRYSGRQLNLHLAPDISQLAATLLLHEKVVVCMC
ncbi:hypothetical protein P691DRAFT_378051 [Macrolepiota fuliginosa MF-IS2]|uniref:Uncharacterized protein n=1 Tax=Macrolepiota fuliginosa MF-IS2 TaxID=1400762 RepID=A0A9P5X589_9AGAR|nr:hypothetical protein P691DRAFT_378051 [Macrolepiota fuliginosa MF-IS2]